MKQFNLHLPTRRKILEGLVNGNITERNGDNFHQTLLRINSLQ